MAAASIKRKLTTILFADAQGYSAQMASDEAATLERLNRYRSIMAELFSRHDGRQVNTWGDAVIAEFSSVVEAVRCAVEIQDSLSSENSQLPKSRQMWFRIGINLGDVMIDRGDLYGDGVNVAQRLESRAEPGGIMVSGTVHSLTYKQLALAFDYAGEQEVTNSQDRVPSYRVRMAGRNLPDAAEQAVAEDATGPSATPDARFARAGGQLDGFWAWLISQPKRVRLSIGMIIFFFLVNLLTGSILINPWFIYPSAPFAIFAFLSLRNARNRGQPPPASDS
jgi:adenylate cyclase